MMHSLNGIAKVIAMTRLHFNKHHKPLALDHQINVPTP